MKTILLTTDSHNAISSALEISRNGGLVAFPTDTVYGVGALAFDAPAVESIYIAKDRPVEKAIPILIGGPEDLDKVTSDIPSIAAKLAARFWPGPLTLVVPKHPKLPEVVSAGPTVGVRVPDHPVARALLTAAGPMAVTSANISGQASPKTAEEVFRPIKRTHSPHPGWRRDARRRSFHGSELPGDGTCHPARRSGHTERNPICAG